MSLRHTDSGTIHHISLSCMTVQIPPDLGNSLSLSVKWADIRLDSFRLKLGDIHDRPE